MTLFLLALHLEVVGVVGVLGLRQRLGDLIDATVERVEDPIEQRTDRLGDHVQQVGKRADTNEGEDHCERFTSGCGRCKRSITNRRHDGEDEVDRALRWAGAWRGSSHAHHPANRLHAQSRK